MTVRVVVVDDQDLIRSGVVALVSHTPGMEVVGEASDGERAVDIVRQTLPDVVLMDIRMPELDGISATERIVADPELAGVRVIILTTFEGDAEVLGALRAGASGFLGKGSAPDELVAGIRTVAAGDALLSPAATAAVVEHVLAEPVTHTSVDSDALNRLTPREREVVALVAQGLSNDEIAERLFVSPLTAKTHVSRALTKTGVRDRVQLVVLAYRSGLITPS